MSTDKVARPRQFQLEQVDEGISPPTLEPAVDPKTAKLQAASINLLMLALQTLAQRTIVALSKCFTLLTVLAAFWLWMSIPDPTMHQLVALGIYAVFTLVINWIVLRRNDA